MWNALPPCGMLFPYTVKSEQYKSYMRKRIVESNFQNNDEFW